MLLKQSTAVVIQFGPFVDKTDGVTLETGLVSALDHASTGIMLSKNGGTLAVRHATVTASTYDAHGCYKVTLDTTDTATLGSLRVIYTDAATCVAVWQDFQVVPANVYDSLVGGSDTLQVDVAQFGNSNGTFSGGRPEVNTSHVGGTSQTARDLGASVLISAGTGTGQLDVTSGRIKADSVYFGGVAGTFSSGRPEVNMTHIAGTAWASTTLFTLASHDPGENIMGATDLTNGGIADAVWDEAIAGHAGAGSTGEALSAAGSAGDPWNTALPGAYSSGKAGYILGTYLDAAISGIPTATQNADALLNRDMSAVTVTNSRSPINAFRFIRNKWVISGGTLTVYKEDDSTSAWTATVSSDAAADPIVGNDPA